MKFPEYWTNVDKLNRLQRMVLLHSIIYYEFDESVITDDYYNKLARLLARKVKQYKDKPIFKDTMYWYVFEDYTDGSSGYYLLRRLKTKDYKYLRLLATHIIKRAKENRE